MAKLKPIKKTGNEDATFSEISTSGGSLSAFEEYKTTTDKRIADIETLTKAILFLAVVSLIGIIVAVSSMVIDQMRFNTSTYNNYKGSHSEYHEQKAIQKTD